MREHIVCDDDESAALDGEPGQEDGNNTSMHENARSPSQLGQKPGVMESGDLGTEEHEKARLIAEGVQAWKILTGQKVPDPTHAASATARASTPTTVASSISSTGEDSDHRSQKKINGHEVRKDSKGSSRHPRKHSRGSGHESQQHSDSMVPSRPKENSGDGGKCPFASTFGSMPVGHPKTKLHDSGPQPPESLPTPPENSIKHIRSPTASKRRFSDALSSAPPSAAGSASKCPIRFLDHYSPEEVAEYFKNHKHEIPRSHEVCVKRYQSNAERIRQLDAKYGNMVNMIQGLGAKHLSLLPDAKEDEDNSPALHGKSIQDIKNWAEGVQNGPEEALDTTTKPDSISNPQPQQGGTKETACNTTTLQADSRRSHSHMPNNLKEIRLGESPSRLGVVTVPMPSDSHNDDVDDNDDDDDDDDEKAYDQPAAEGRDSQTSLLQERPRQARIGRQHPRMVFTGPVFIGYSPEQAATVLRQAGLEERGMGNGV